ncbi:hypothetical protein LUZ60_014172 [Juncus effusus]|nr:hypothetical protein LUZ60_014172 [Juncus effusus]
MEAIKRQATRLREQVAKQHHAVFRQFTSKYSQDPALVDEEELQCHQNLQKLYNSTKSAKQLQRNITRGIQNFISISTKQMEIVKRLAEDCCKYGNENQVPDFALAKASLDFGNSHNLMEKEKEILLTVLADQVFEPLRDMIMSAPLEDARLLTYRYERIRQDVESQIAEVVKRQMKSKESGVNTESVNKLKNAELKLADLQMTLNALGREATSAMLAVEAQQQKITYEKLLFMVEAERNYHQSAATILDKLHDDMVLAKEQSELLIKSGEIATNSQLKSIAESPESIKSIENSNNNNNINNNYNNNNTTTTTTTTTSTNNNTNNNNNNDNGQSNSFSIAEVMHPFDAQAEGELTLSVGDDVTIRQVSTNGWSEGECNGKSGWFPSAYVAVREKTPVGKSKITESDSG